MTDTQSSPVTAEELLRDVKTFFNHGEFFRAYDLAADALELFPGNVGLAHVGNTEMAKHYGRLRMFLLRRVGDGKGPPVLGDIERAASSNGVLQDSNVG